MVGIDHFRFFVFIPSQNNHRYPELVSGFILYGTSYKTAGQSEVENHAVEYSSLLNRKLNDFSINRY
ncbi:hypothetical protein [Pedobacter sp.]|uniref:hypothetical protein n=1 Tax=Pedobacter sp. TaxID=1411316 RepID=UPI00396C728B